MFNKDAISSRKYLGVLVILTFSVSMLTSWPGDKVAIAADSGLTWNSVDTTVTDQSVPGVVVDPSKVNQKSVQAPTTTQNTSNSDNSAMISVIQKQQEQLRQQQEEQAKLVNSFLTSQKQQQDALFSYITGQQKQQAEVKAQPSSSNQQPPTIKDQNGSGAISSSSAPAAPAMPPTGAAVAPVVPVNQPAATASTDTDTSSQSRNGSQSYQFRIQPIGNPGFVYRPAPSTKEENKTASSTQQTVQITPENQGAADNMAAGQAKTYTAESDVREVVVEQPKVITKIVYVDRPQPPASVVTEPEVRKTTGDYIQENTQDSGDAIAKEAEVSFFYYPGGLYKVNTKEGFLTDIRLQPGESVLSIMGGDTSRWTVDQAVSGTGTDKQSHVYIKPLKAGLETNLIINTDHHSYQILVRSSSDRPVPMVAWSYPQETKAAFVRQQVEEKKKDDETIVMAGKSIDKINFNYAVRGNKYAWTPTMVCDDGVKTFIKMPDAISSNELPALFVKDTKGNLSMVNYRFKNGYFIVDRLFNEAELRNGADQAVTIKRTDR